MGNLEKGFTNTYAIKDKANGVYAFVLEGTINIDGQNLNKRDGFGVWNTDMINIKATSDAKVLLMDVPMQG